jgi:hypothetical protein
MWWPPPDSVGRRWRPPPVSHRRAPVASLDHRGTVLAAMARHGVARDRGAGPGSHHHPGGRTAGGPRPRRAGARMPGGPAPGRPGSHAADGPRSRRVPATPAARGRWIARGRRIALHRDAPGRPRAGAGAVGPGDSSCAPIPPEPGAEAVETAAAKERRRYAPGSQGRRRCRLGPPLLVDNATATGAWPPHSGRAGAGAMRCHRPPSRLRCGTGLASG